MAAPSLYYTQNKCQFFIFSDWVNPNWVLNASYLFFLKTCKFWPMPSHSTVKRCMIRDIVTVKGKQDFYVFLLFNGSVMIYNDFQGSYYSYHKLLNT